MTWIRRAKKPPIEIIQKMRIIDGNRTHKLILESQPSKYEDLGLSSHIDGGKIIRHIPE